MSKPIYRDLRKCEIVQSLGGGMFRAKDLLNQEKMRVQMTAKQRINYTKLLPGDQIYAKYSEYLKENRFISDFDFKWRENLSKEKKLLDELLKEMGKD